MKAGIVAMLEARRRNREALIAAGGRLCNTCQKWFPWEALASDGPKAIMGKRPLCKACRFEKERAYRQEKPEIGRVRQARYRRNNPEKIRAYSRDYERRAREKNTPYGERLREYQKIYKKVRNAFQTGICSPLLRRNGFAVARLWERHQGVWGYRYRAARIDQPLEKGEALVARVLPSETEPGKWLCFPSPLKMDEEAQRVQKILLVMTMHYDKKGGR